MAQEHVAAARDALAVLPRSAAQASLAAMAEFVISRRG
jgi:geranylgeranyl pyrophosphate synthase